MNPVVAAADRDPLTGLSGRGSFLTRLHEAFARGRDARRMAVALLLLDVDRFKSVNESFGHAAGDQLLRDIAERIGRTVAAAGCAARIDGDEFAVLFEQMVDPGFALRTAERVQRAIEEPFLVGGQQLYASASMGIAFAGERCADAEELLRAADAAARRAKQAGPGVRVVFEPGMREANLAEHAIETGLRAALDRGEIVAHFQPVVALDTLEVRGFEALARWHHPEEGWIPPASFIPAAERTGLIGRLGMEILRSACAGMRLLRLSSPRPLTLSVNLSAAQLFEPSLLEQVAYSLGQAGLDPSQLRLEVTESVLVNRFEAAAGVLQNLRRLGVRICMDDFGTGYSSLGYLHQLPIDGIKIDRSFVAALDRGEKAAGILQAIVVLARNVGAELVAEGVETEAQAEALRGLGCRLAQGYRFARALPIDEACALVLRGEGR